MNKNNPPNRLQALKPPNRIVNKRYSEFLELHLSLEGKYAEIKLARFPQKQFFSLEKDIEDREAMLDSYVKVIATICPLPIEVKSFLGLTARDLTLKSTASETSGTGGESLAVCASQEPSLVHGPVAPLFFKLFLCLSSMYSQCRL